MANLSNIHTTSNRSKNAMRVQKPPAPTSLPLPPAFKSLSQLIGRTPLIAIRLSYKGSTIKIYSKLEYYNLSGSIKDRMALEVLKNAYSSGVLQPGNMIVEATSGNAGISFSALGRMLGHPVRIYMPDWMSEERISLMKSYGADVRLVSSDEGGFLGSIQKAQDLARTRNDVFLPCQFSNKDNCAAHYKNTGAEIIKTLNMHDLTPDAFIAGVGTGGTVMGVGKTLREVNLKVKIHPLEPAESPTLSTGYKVGQHRIQGISDEFIPDIVCLKTLDDVIAVNDGDAILMAQKLSQSLGLAVGISSGANLVGAVKLAQNMEAGAIIATIFADDNKKYLSTNLTGTEPIKDHYLTPNIELIDFEVC